MRPLALLDAGAARPLLSIVLSPRCPRRPRAADKSFHCPNPANARPCVTGSVRQELKTPSFAATCGLPLSNESRRRREQAAGEKQEQHGAQQHKAKDTAVPCARSRSVVAAVPA